MHWASWSEFFSMGGFGAYVWGSYGITFFLLGAEVLMLFKRRRTLKKRAPQLRSHEGQLETSLQEMP